MAKDRPIRIGLQVTERTEHEFYHLTARPVTIGPTLWELRYMDQSGESHNVPADRIRGFGSDPEGTGLYLECLIVTSQGDHVRGARHLYGWDIEYREVYSVTASKAARMAKTLDTIARRMQKTAEQYGAPSTFGAYLARVAAAIGATTIVRPGKMNPDGWNTDRILSVADGVYSVDRSVQEWIAAGAEQVTT